MEVSLTGRIAKLAVVSGIAVGTCAFVIYKYYKRRESKSIDEGFEEVSRLEESPEKRILVMGLENSGKSTIVSQVTSGSSKNQEIRPTEGFNVTCLHSGGVLLNIWEIGGRESYRRYWSNFLQDTDVLVFVVDSANPGALLGAVKELKGLLGDDRLSGVPLLVVANKQDLPNAFSPEEVAVALDLNSLPPGRRRVEVLGTQATPGVVKRHPSMAKVEQAMLSMASVH